MAMDGEQHQTILERSDFHVAGSSIAVKEELQDEAGAHYNGVDHGDVGEEETGTEDQLESTRAEMDEVREENERLKRTLAQIMKDYQSLQTRVSDIVDQQAQADEKKPTQKLLPGGVHQDIEEQELFSLSLGRKRFSEDETKMDEKNIKPIKRYREDGHDEFRQSLSLGFDYKVEVSKPVLSESMTNPSPQNSFNDSKEEICQAQAQPAASKGVKSIRSSDDEVLQQTPVKKARVSVRSRCDTPTMNDGCQWRKYGQKVAKGNPCPRAYYRCTVGSACPVRKQVQRCSDDMSILITTYEGNHNHPLPVSATAMASTTSAAASMLMSGSSTTTTNPANLHGLNFNILSGITKHSYNIPNSSSSSSSHPTITLDLTGSSSSTSASLSSTRSQYYCSIPPPQKYSSTYFNFSNSSTEFNTAATSSSLPTSWGGNNTSTDQQKIYNDNIKTRMDYSLSLGKQINQEQLYHPYVTNNKTPSLLPQKPLSRESSTIEAATKAITSDPSFQLALASAIKSIVGGGNGADQTIMSSTRKQGSGVGDSLGLSNSLKWASDPFSTITPTLNFGQNLEQNLNVVGCASSYLNRTRSLPSTSTSSNTHHQQGKSNSNNLLMFVAPPSLPFSSNTKSSASTSPEVE